MKFLKKLLGFKESNMTHDENVNQEVIKLKLLSMLEPFKRAAYIPNTKEVAKKFNSESKFGGFPYIRSRDEWPVCPNCQNHLQLFLQLNLNQIPGRNENAVIQLFYCTNEDRQCESECEAYDAFSTSVVCRRIDIQGESLTIEPKLDYIFPEKTIVSWKQITDYPHYEEFEDLGLRIDLDDYEILEQEEIGIPAAGDKLYGWPHWIQSAEYPYDRKTASRMNLLFQLDSEVNLPFMFGDSGIGHLTQSPDDVEELAFAWACC